MREGRSVIVPLAISLVLLASPSWGQYASNPTVSQWRLQFSEYINLSSIPLSGQQVQDYYRIAFVYGAWNTALTFTSCSVANSVAELKGFLEGTAQPTESVRQALAAFFAQHGCRTMVDEDSLAQAHQKGREELAESLAVVRTLSNPEALKGLVEWAEANNTNAEAVAYGLIAGARLLELQRGTAREPVPFDVER